MLPTRCSQRIGYRIKQLIRLSCILYQCISNRRLVFETLFWYSTATSEAVSVDNYNGVQRREIGRPETALKRGSQINSFIRNELGYHVHACPQTVSVTTVDGGQLFQPRRWYVWSGRGGCHGPTSIFGQLLTRKKLLATDPVIWIYFFWEPFVSSSRDGLFRTPVNSNTKAWLCTVQTSKL